MCNTSTLKKKGLVTLSLITLAETIAISDAVHFSKLYQKWSYSYGRDSRRSEGYFSNDHNKRTQFESKYCQSKDSLSSDRICDPAVVGKAASIPTSTKLHPRQSSRLASTAFIDCCKKSSPNCFNALDIRGGHAHVLDETLTAAAAVSHSLPTPYNLPLNLWKVIFQIFLTAMNVACWLIPLRSKKITENKLSLSIANAFSGGVFLSLAFGHLIPECVHGFEGMNESLPYMIVLGGYLLIFFVEKVAFDAHGLMHDCGADHLVHDGKNEVVELANKGEESSSNGRSAVILLGALAVHSVLEMTALGLAKTFGDSALLSLSIALHQPAESIALLVAFLKSGMSQNQIMTYLSIFSAMGPIGVAIGMAVNQFAAPIIDSIMLAAVAGTFVYVGATEVIPEEWEEQDYKWTKFFALMSGIVSIFCITQYTMSFEGHTH